jgi:hypothetical protein
MNDCRMRRVNSSSSVIARRQIAPIFVIGMRGSIAERIIDSQ